MWELLLRSAPAFGTLARHALIALGENGTTSRRDAITKLAARAGFDPAPILQLFDIREHKLDKKTMRADDIFAPYLRSVEHITKAVDEMLD